LYVVFRPSWCLPTHLPLPHPGQPVPCGHISHNRYPTVRQEPSVVVDDTPTFWAYLCLNIIKIQHDALEGRTRIVYNRPVNRCPYPFLLSHITPTGTGASLFTRLFSVCTDAVLNRHHTERSRQAPIAGTSPNTAPGSSLGGSESLYEDLLRELKGGREAAFVAE
jgi:hypothetical protein